MKAMLRCMDYIQRWLKILTKQNTLEVFKLNDAQRRLYEIIRSQVEAGKPVRIIILKARQMGFSTVIGGIIFWMAATMFHVQAMVVAHQEKATNNLFKMYRRFYENLPDRIRPLQRASNAQELVFDRPTRYKGKSPGLDSKILCATAGGKGVGRSYMFKCLHLSEFAFWPGDKKATLTGLMQAVPDEPGTFVFIESTANGFEEFKNQWDLAVESQAKGEDGFIPVFFPWFEMKEYRRAVPPGFVRTEEEEELVRVFHLDDEQLAWRRWCIKINCGGDLNLFHQEYPATPDEAFISTGKCVFDKQQLVLRRKEVAEAAWERGRFRIAYDLVGKIQSYQWEADPKGPVRIRVHPEAYVPYVLGGDTAGTGSNFFAAHVLDNRTGDQVAVLHHQFGEREFSEQVYCLGMYYNEALVGVEINYSTYPQKCLEELGYRHFYVREVLDTYTGKLKQAFGFETTTKSRPLIIDGLKDVAKSALETIYDYDTLGEMLTFVYDENWKPQAEEGENDDLVLSLAIANIIRSQQEVKLVQVSRKAGRWTQDMWDDYNRGSPEERLIMEDMWGKPR